MGEKTVPLLEMNLVRYSNPVAVIEREEELLNKKLDGTDDLISNEKNKKYDEILNCIFPPREWEKNGKQWRQKVSNQPATRMDVIKLAKMLDMSLQHLNARETGICPIRSAVYSQCFDEILRQVTIDCAKRGLLLLKVRDELKMTMDVYQSIYESSIVFSTKKLLSAEHKLDMQDQVTELEVKKQNIKNDLATAIAKYEMAQRKGTKRRIALQQRHNIEINLLKRSNQQLRTLLEGITEQGNKLVKIKPFS